MQHVQQDAGTTSSLLRKKIEELGPWFHNVRLPDGTETLPNHWIGGDFPRFKWDQLAPHIPADLTGWSVLDIGCNAGFYSFELAKRGALVTGIDLDEHYLKQARWLAEELGLTDKVRFSRMQVYDLARTSDQYDLVLFMGVFYHLRYPLLGLDIVSEKVRRMLVFQTLSTQDPKVYPTPEDIDIFERQPLDEEGWPKMAFVEHKIAEDPTNWWVPNKAGCEAMLRSAGFKIVGYPMDEGYLCIPDPENVPVTRSWAEKELRAATGRPWQSESPRNGNR